MTSKGEKGILTLYSDVQATSVRWLWYPFIAVGKITLLQDDPGDGKSTMMMHLIAELSKGGTLPDGKTIGMPQRSIYQCSEDGISDTIKPQLEKCGADCRNVAFINEETYSGLTLDDERIRQAIIEFRPRLVVIDPIQAYLGSDSDLQIAGRARRLMQRLGMWASMYDCAIVLIGHLNKKRRNKGPLPEPWQHRCCCGCPECSASRTGCGEVGYPHCAADKKQSGSVRWGNQILDNSGAGLQMAGV